MSLKFEPLNPEVGAALADALGFALGGRRHDPLGTEHFFFFFTLGTGPRRSLSLKLSDTRVYEPQIRARLGTTAHFFKVVVLKLRHKSQNLTFSELCTTDRKDCQVTLETPLCTLLVLQRSWLLLSWLLMNFEQELTFAEL